MIGGRSNMNSNAIPAENDTVFYDVRQDPFEIYGLYNAKTEPVFKRLPDEIGQNVNKGVKSLYLDTAGGRVRFSTDSQYIRIKAVMPNVRRFAHMSLLGTSGFDLYVDFDEPHVESRYHGSFIPSVDMTNGYEAELTFPDRKMRQLTLNLPPYNHLDELYIGLQADARLEGGKKYKNDRPVVFYGSSITQGACSSRPGMNYQNIISRRFDLDYTNLGFSGNAKGEEIIARYMSELSMSAFVCDYDHNAPNPEHLLNTHKRLYEIIREKNPTLPYLMLSRPDFDVSYRESEQRRNVIMDTFRYARANGDKNVYYIDGEGIFRGADENECTTDGKHPNDIGFVKLADSVGAMLNRIMRKW